jgi:WD40 repeat protein
MTTRQEASVTTARMSVELRTAQLASLDPNKPYPGLHAFEERDAAFFYGRERELDELFGLVREQRLTLVYGKSGLGKTSLLQAGLFPRLRANGFFPMRFRHDFDASGGAARRATPFAQQVRDHIIEAIRDDKLDAEEPTERPLWEYFSLNGFWDSAGRPVVPVLVMDQFEEVFTLGQSRKKEVDLLFIELADLIENRIPEVLRLEAEQEGGAISFPMEPPRARVVISMREDFLAEIEAYQRSLPSLAKGRFRLGPLRGAQAVDAVRRPAPHLVTGDVAEEIVRVVAGSAPGTKIENLEVESSLLALYCRQLNERRGARERIDAGLLLSSAQTILEDFYTSCVAGSPPTLVRLIEEELLSESDRRETRSLELFETRGVDPAEIYTLVNRRLLRLEPRLGGQLYVELIHDKLTATVAKHRAIRRAEEQREAESRREHEERARREEALQREKEKAEREAQAARASMLVVEKERAEEALRAAKEQRRLVTVLVTIVGAAIVVIFYSITRSARQDEEAHTQSTALDLMAGADREAEQARRFAASRQWADAGRSVVNAWSSVQGARKARDGILERRSHLLARTLFLSPLDELRPPDELLGILSARAQAATVGGSLLYPDSGGAGAFAVSENGRTAAVVGSDGRTVKLLDLSSGKATSVDSPSTESPPPNDSGPREQTEVKPIQWFTGSVKELTMSGDGTRLFGKGEHGQIVVWDSSGKRLFGFRTMMDAPSLSLDRAGRVALLRETSGEGKAPLVVPLGESAAGAPFVLKRVLSAAPGNPDAPASGEWQWILQDIMPDGSAVVGLREDIESEKKQAAPTFSWYVWPMEARGEPHIVPLQKGGAPVTAIDAAALGAQRPLLSTYSESKGLQIWDTKNGALAPLGSARRTSLESVERLLFVEEDRVLIAQDGPAVEVFDVTDPAAPKPIFATNLQSPPSSLSVVRSGGSAELLAITSGLLELHSSARTAPVVIPLLNAEGSLTAYRAELRAGAREAVFAASDGLRRTIVKAQSGGDRVVWAGSPPRENAAERVYREREIGDIERVDAQGDRVALLSQGNVWILEGLRSRIDDPGPDDPQGSPEKAEEQLIARRWLVPKVSGIRDFAFAGEQTAAFDEDGHVELGVPVSGVDAGPTTSKRIAVPGLAKALYEQTAILDVSRDGRWAIGGGWGPKVYAWDIARNEVRFIADVRRESSDGALTLPDRKVTALAALSDLISYPGKPQPAAIVGDADGQVRVFRAEHASRNVQWSTLSREPSNEGVQHAGAVRVLAVADDRRFASGSDDGLVFLWDIKGDKGAQRLSATRLTMAPHVGGVAALRFSADRSVLISGGRDRTARVWNVAREFPGCEMQEHAEAIVGIEMDPDPDPPHQHVLTRDASGLTILWNATSDPKICTALRRFRGLIHAAFVPRRSGAFGDVRRIVTVSRNGDVELIEGDMEPDAARSPRGAIIRGQVLGDRLIAMDDESGLFSFSLDRVEAPRFIEKPFRVAAQATAKGLWIGLEHSGRWITQQEGFDAKAKGSLEGFSEGALITAASLSADGRRLLAVGTTPALGKARLGAHLFDRVDSPLGWSPSGSGFELKDGPATASSRCRGGPVGPRDSRLYAAGFKGTEPRVVAVDQRGCIRVWDGGSLTIEDQLQVPEGRLSVIALSPAAETMALGDADGAVRFCSFLDKTGNKAELRFLGSEPRRHSFAVRTLAFHPKSRFVMSGGGDGQAWLWDAQDGRALVPVGLHPGAVLWAAFRQDGTEALTGGAQGWVHDWSTRLEVEDPEAIRRTICEWLPAGDTACIKKAAAPGEAAAGQ